MKPIVLPAALACVTLFVLRAAAAAPEAPADTVQARAAIVAASESSPPESPAAAFERMLSPRTPVQAPAAAGASPDALTHAFNASLWSAPALAMHQARAPGLPTGSTK